MPLALRSTGQCAFCAFRNSEWLASSIARQRSRQFTTAGVEVRRVQARRVRPERSVSDRAKKASPKVSHAREDHRAASVSPTEKASGVKRPIFRDETPYGIFGKLVLEQTELLLSRLQSFSQKHVREAWGLDSHTILHKEGAKFKDQLRETCEKADKKGIVIQQENPLFYRLRRAFVAGDVRALAAELKHSFLNSVVAPKLSPQDNLNQRKLADLRYPLEWFPATRALQRTVHLHVGPTNSGKTYHALQRLEAAESGIYAGPLRLLAHEVYTRLNAKGKKCALITGEERRLPEGMKNVMNSCTVEMVPLNAKVDVAVIDEIQMMGDLERGWAWTQAFLGVQAKEVHLCGELRTIEIITDLCNAMGDKLVIHKYKRLSRLETMDTSLKGDLKNIQKGDAVILFSRLAIHGMKANIEKITGKRCAVVYGSLPPETRAQQAALFNDPNNDYDCLVASDAVGMGLNLSIKRVVFEATSKHDGVGWRLISTPEIKQIGGRAGRYKTAHQAVQEGPNDPNDPNDGAKPVQLDLTPKHETSMGLVTTIEDFDLPIVRRAMTTKVEPLKSAGIFPPSSILMRFASYFPPETPFSYVILRLHEISTLSPRFHMCRLKEHVEVSDLIQPYNLSIMDRIIFTTAPVALRDSGFPQVVQEYAKCVAEQSGGELLDLKSLKLELLDQDIHELSGGSMEYLRKAETLHKALTLYLWLSYRFAGVFRSQALAFHVKSLVEEKIDECLAEVDWDESKRKQVTIARQKALGKQAKEMDDRVMDSTEPDQLPSPAKVSESLDELDEMSADSEDSSASEANIPPLMDRDEVLAEMEELRAPGSNASIPVDWNEAQRGTSMEQSSDA